MSDEEQSETNTLMSPTPTDPDQSHTGSVLGGRNMDQGGMSNPSPSQY